MLQLPLIDIMPPSLNPQNDLEYMATKGYLVKSGLIEESLIEEVRNWTRSRFSQTDIHDTNRVQDAFKESQSVFNLATHPMVLSLLEELYGRRPIPFQTLNFPRGTQQGTHSDAFHFNCWPQRWMCGVWVALEDVNEFNGPLHYYPGSHRLPILDAHDSSALNNQYCNYEIAVQELITIAGLKKETFLPRKGDCLIWAANLLHGGDPILDQRSSRLSQVSHYYFDGCDFFTPRSSDFAISDIYFRDEVLDISTGSMIYSRHHRQVASLYSDRFAAPQRKRERLKLMLWKLYQRASTL